MRYLTVLLPLFFTLSGCSADSYTPAAMKKRELEVLKKQEKEQEKEQKKFNSPTSVPREHKQPWEKYLY